MRINFRIVSILVVLGLACAGYAGASRGAGVAAQTAPDPLRVAAQATVRIIAGSSRNGEFRGQVTGTGVILTAGGVVMTTPSALAGNDSKPATEIWAALTNPMSELAHPHRAVRLKTLVVNHKQGIVLLQLQQRENKTAKYPFLRLAPTDELRYGAPVTMLGFQAGRIGLARHRCAVIDFDDQGGWVLTESGLGNEAAGGPVLNERGELVGIQDSARRSAPITFFGDEEYPLGTVNVGEPGAFRSWEQIITVLQAPETLAAGIRFEYLQPSYEQQVTGKVRDKRTGEVIAGAIIGLIIADGITKTPYVTARELAGHARSDFSGGFALSRRVKAGQYLLKVVHPQYRTLVQDITIDPLQRDFTVELMRN